MEGGSERYFFEVSRLLRKYEQEIAFFCMNEENSYPTKWKKYFVSNIPLDQYNIYSLVRLFSRITYSFESKNKISNLLRIFNPSIAHMHIFNSFISPSIIPVLKGNNIPIVQTLHDYQLIAPTRGSLFHDNSICEVTKTKSYYKAIIHKCIRNSYFATIPYALSLYLTNILKIYEYIDYFISPSDFLRNKYIEYGFDPKKIITLPYFVNTGNYKSNLNNSHNNYVLYFGRLSPEKGLELLIDAFKCLSKINLVIAGTGKQDYVRLLKVKSANSSNIKFLGYLNGYKLKSIIAGCKFSIVPSIWYENLPNSILESFAASKPVLGSNIGGVPEIITNGYNGLLFKPGDLDDITDKILKLWNNSALCTKLGRNANDTAIKFYSPHVHYIKLMEIYKKAIASH